MKRVLVVYYSQSGQLLEIAKNITKKLDSSNDVDLSFYQIKLKNDFPFPWDKKAFYDAFPESFLQIPTDLDGLDNPILQNKYDLIILAYQVWYLSPSIPVNSFLKNKASQKVFNNTPVITVIGCRNMWVLSQEKMKMLLFKKKANLVGNIALVDNHHNHISVITILNWMFTGNKQKYLGIFPKPGVSDKDIEESERFGNDILKAIKNNSFDDLQDELLGKGAIKIKPFLITVDRTANIIFRKWANLILKKEQGNHDERRKWLQIFSYYLMFAIWIISPIVFIVYLITYPFKFNQIKRDKIYYSQTKLK